MSKPDIRRMLFWGAGTVYNFNGYTVELMPKITRILADHTEIRVAIPRSAPSSIAVDIVSLFPEVEFTYLTQEHASHSDTIQDLATRGLLPKDTLYIDHDGQRCMAAFRAGVYVNVFEDPLRLYRDIGAWQIIPFEPSLTRITELLNGQRRA